MKKSKAPVELNRKDFITILLRYSMTPQMVPRSKVVLIDSLTFMRDKIIATRKHNFRLIKELKILELSL